MISKIHLIESSFILLLLGAATLFAGFETGKSYNGFKLLKKKFVKEVNAECLYFQHEKSGARLLKIQNDDPNKTFSIAFKTLPETDCGTPHIMEHSVLNGSKHFPVKSPFDVLAKGSLNTFLNAMTGSDITIYPVASMNDKDYFNLMHVYLDAVLFPRIYNDLRILNQEGWHHELESADSPVIYKGVVYNEMKGAFSSPTRELDYQIYKNLFPDNTYGFSSGGYPKAIPELTHEHFLNFHRKFYHPDNSYIYLYGNADLSKELEFIDEKYLSEFKKTDNEISIPLQKPFKEMKEAVGYYPVAEGSDTKDQTYLALNFVTGLNTDRSLVMALQALRELLVGQESAPIRLALQEAGIGKEVSASLDDNKQNVFQIIVQNANPEDKDKFLQVVMETLKKTVEEGLEKDAIEGTINRFEFRLREGDDAQKGLTYNFQALSGWFFAQDPFLSLEYEKPLAELKKALKSDLLESIIKEHFLNNPHTLLQVLEPKPGLEQENNEAAETELAEFKADLSDDELNALVEETKALIAFQKEEDSEEALATIPMLSLSDITPEAEWYDVETDKVSDIPVLHHDTFTNNVVYTDLFFDIRVLPEELIPYASVLSAVLGNLSTENYEYGDLDIALNIHTGGFYTNLDTYLEDRKDENLLPKFIVASKAMKTKVPKLFDLIEEVVTRTQYTDNDRLKSVLTRHQSRLESRMKRNGYYYASMRLQSYYSKEGKFIENTRGVDYYWFVTELVNQFDENVETIKENLAKTASLLFNRENMIAGVTCDAKDLGKFKKELKGFAKSLPDDKVKLNDWVFDYDNKNEGLATASKVQYVIKGYDYKKLGYEWDGKMRVLNQVLSRDYLQNKIRVIGGAYGGFAVLGSDGKAYFASYRDPNLGETLDNYDATPEFLKNFEADETVMTRFIIGTIARMDRPRTPSSKGDVAFARYFQKSTKEELQKDREAVLATTPEDIQAFEKFVTDVLAQDVHCVYGSEEKIEAEKDRFGTVVKVFQ